MEEGKYMEDGEREELIGFTGAEPDDDIFSRNIPVWEIPEEGGTIRQLSVEQPSKGKFPAGKPFAKKFPEEKLPEKKFPEEKLPEEKLPEEKLPEEKPSEEKPSEEEELLMEAKPAEDDLMKSEVESLKAQLATARADHYNYRQRMERDRSKFKKLVIEDKVLEFLPVLDNLDRALSVPENGTAKDVLVGVRMVQRQFLSILENSDITIIPVEGCTFDPLVHDAVETEFVDAPEEDGAILYELLRGYRTPERVLRPAQVRVGRMRPLGGEE